MVRGASSGYICQAMYIRGTGLVQDTVGGEQCGITRAVHRGRNMVVTAERYVLHITELVIVIHVVSIYSNKSITRLSFLPSSKKLFQNNLVINNNNNTR